MAGMKQDDIDLVELNEAFASQSLAVIKGLDLDMDKINVKWWRYCIRSPVWVVPGLNFPFSCFNELKKRDKKIWQW